MCGWAASQGDLGMGPVDFKQGEVGKECFRPELAGGAEGVSGSLRVDCKGFTELEPDSVT